MSKERTCFCGSKKPWIKCHPKVINNSRFVKMYRIYKKVDREISKQIKEKNLCIECKKGCSECCSSNFAVSELEFCIIADYLIKKKSGVEIQSIMEKAYNIKNYILKNYPEDLELLEADFTGLENLDSIIAMGNEEPRGEIPKCIFLSDKNSCTIYDVRPLICRVHGTSYFNENCSNELCSKLSIDNSNLNKFVDLTQFQKESTYAITFYDKRNSRMCIRRAYPLFYWFNMLKEVNLSLNKFVKTILFARYTLMNEEECSEDLIKSISNR